MLSANCVADMGRQGSVALYRYEARHQTAHVLKFLLQLIQQLGLILLNNNCAVNATLILGIHQCKMQKFNFSCNISIGAINLRADNAHPNSQSTGHYWPQGEMARTRLASLNLYELL